MMRRALGFERAAFPGGASASGADESADSVTLDYEARFLRRRTLTTDAGHRLLVDLPETVSLDEGDALLAEDGARIVIRAAPEPLVRVAGDLARLAWHVGNRHTPAQIAADHLLIRRDAVIEDMLNRLGATLEHIEAPFTPEGGAYGHGRTHSHDHGHSHHVPAGEPHSHDH